MAVKQGEFPAIFGGKADQINQVYVPENYIYKNGYPQPIDHENVPYMDPLFIDFSLLLDSSDPKLATVELHKLKSALSSWGCFQLINHGIPSSFLDEMQETSKQFIALPMEEKQKYARQDDVFNGYSYGKIDDDSKDKVVDWNEGLSLTVYPEDRRHLKFWPQKPSQFKNLLHDYTMKLTDVFEVLFKKIVNSMNIDEEQISDRYGKNKEVNLRFNFYPRCPNPDRVLGLKPHSDFSPLTIILQDEAGVQVEKDGQWFMVPVITDALFVQIGDSLEIMSNGIFKSAMHRVVTNAEKARASIALFWDSDRHNELGPLDELITNDRPQLYKRVSYKQYTINFYDYYQTGKRPIDDVRM